MIKLLKTVLCTTAAVAAFTTSGHADDLFNLKSLMEGLNTREATSQVSVQVPGGYTINPTADSAVADEGAAVEEPFTEVKISGFLKVGYIFNEQKDGGPTKGGTPRDASSDIDAEIGLNVRGSVQSSLGEVGVTLQTRWEIAESTTNAVTNSLRDEGAIAFWQFLPTVKLEGGRSNSGRLENGFDKNTRRLWTFGNRRVRSENAGSGFFDRDAYNGFLGLAYASGPLSFNIRANDATRGASSSSGPSITNSDDDALGVSGKGLYTGEMFSLEVAGGYWGQDDADLLLKKDQNNVKWLAGVGAELNFIPGIPLSVAVQTGRLHNDTETLNFSGSVGFTLTDDITAGFSAGWRRISNVPPGSTFDLNHTERVLHAEIYYAPLAQMLIGLEGDYIDDGKSNAGTPPSFVSNDGFAGAIVTRYAF